MDNLMDKLIDFERGLLDTDDQVALFQYLVNTGMAWQLQGFYGRTARDLISEGLVTVPWKAANNGTGKLRWFVMRETPDGGQYLYSASDQLIRFGSFEAANRRAAELNAEQVRQ